MAGIPGLRDMWGAIGDGLDWVGDAASDALAIVASPFVDEEGELFGFIGIDDLKEKYIESREGTRKKPEGTRGLIEPLVENVGEQSRTPTVGPSPVSNKVVEPYPNYNVQATGMKDFKGTVENILKSTESQVEKLRDSIVKGKNISIDTSSSFVDIPDVNIKLPDVVKGD